MLNEIETQVFCTFCKVESKSASYMGVINVEYLDQIGLPEKILYFCHIA